MVIGNDCFQIFKYIQVSRLLVIFASICSALNKICDIIPEVLIGIAIDVVVNSENSIIFKLEIEKLLHQLCFVGILIAFFWI